MSGVLKGIADTMGAIATTANHAQSIHQVGKYFVSQGNNPSKTNQVMELTFNCPATGRLDKPVYISGMSPPGMVKIVSEGDPSGPPDQQNTLEREVYPESNGVWHTALYFSEIGDYVLYAINGEQKVSASISISKGGCLNCPGKQAT